MKAKLWGERCDTLDQLALSRWWSAGHMENQPTLLGQHCKSSEGLQVLDQQGSADVVGGRPQTALGVGDGAPDSELAIEDRHQ